jgi:hypothetical protein
MPGKELGESVSNTLTNTKIFRLDLSKESSDTNSMKNKKQYLARLREELQEYKDTQITFTFALLDNKDLQIARLRKELELYKAANSDVRRIAEERNKAISLAKAAIKLASIGEGQWDYNDDTLELTRIESELEALNPTNK